MNRPREQGVRTLKGIETRVEFHSGEEFAGLVDSAWLLPRLQLSPEAGELDLEQSTLHVWLNGELVYIEDPKTVLGADDDGTLLVSASAAEASGTVSRVGDWLWETWPEVSDVITRLPDGFDDVAYSLDWATGVVGTWVDEEREVDIEVESPLLSLKNPAHRERLVKAAGERSYLVGLNGQVIDIPDPGAAQADHVVHVRTT